MKSIMHDKRRCYICGTQYSLELHHIFPGYGRRKISDENGFTCYLCARHHNSGKFSVHTDRQLMEWLQEQCQKKYEETHTREEFISLIGKNYIKD